MALSATTGLADYISKKQNPYEWIPFWKASPTLTAGRLYSTWTLNGSVVGTAPAASAVTLSSATAGALPYYRKDGSGVVRLAELELYCNVPVNIWLIDRLSQYGGFSGNAASTGNGPLGLGLPARITDFGVDVRAAFEVNTQIGTTTNMCDINYTNTAGASPRDTTIGPCRAMLGGTGMREVGYWAPVPLATDADLGIQILDYVGFGGAATGTAGAYSAVLYKPIAWFSFPGSQRVQKVDLAIRGGSVLPEIPDDACLSMIISSPLTSFAGAFMSGVFRTIWDG